MKRLDKNLAQYCFILINFCKFQIHFLPRKTAMEDIDEVPLEEVEDKFDMLDCNALLEHQIDKKSKLVVGLDLEIARLKQELESTTTEVNALKEKR